MAKILIQSAALIFMAVNIYAAGTPVCEYAIHEDGGIIYNPLSREAHSTDQLAKYSKVRLSHGTIPLNGFTLDYSMPQEVDAYDVIPIQYHLRWGKDAGAFPVAVEAVAFEDIDRVKGRNLYDLALPGRLDLKVTWLGTITANVKPERRNHMKADLSDKPGVYPPIIRKPFVRSGVVEAGDLVWFKFKVVNTGNTILDSEGIGGFSYVPELYKKDIAGNYQLAGTLYNTHIRETGYFYPGESREIWMLFKNVETLPETYGLSPGEYTIRFRAIYRWYKYFDDMVNLWMGNQMFVYEQPFVVDEKPRKAPIQPGTVIMTDGGERDKITRWIHTFEEFMTAYDCWISKPSKSNSVDGTIYLQVAPWTKDVVVKLIIAQESAIRTEIMPITVRSDSLQVRYDADHPACLVKNGLKEPVILSLTMADMRANVQHSPFPERTIRSDVREMMKCGVNLISTTCMPWLYDDMSMPSIQGYGDEHVNIQLHNGDAYKYVLDVAREMGIEVEGWGSYPFNRNNTQDIATWLTGKAYNFETTPDWGIDYAEPDLPDAAAQMWLYQIHRWGDNFFVNHNGYVPITVEDTRGMLRQDINGRWYIGRKSLISFRRWLMNKYRSLEMLNSAWGTDYQSFDEIDPEAGQTPSPYMPNWPFLQYINKSNPFHEWNKPLEDFDIFRTEQRVGNYKDAISLICPEIPNAVVDLRTEGSNMIVAGLDPQSPNPHFRHVYYSQRRAALIPEIIQRSGVIKYHADYPTLPFTPTELRQLVKMSVDQGIVPMYMPQFDNMRDMAINDKYGSDFQLHYNLPTPKKGAMMHVLTALYPWFVATYEEGGTPGILWQDYECDGFATETQKREMILFRQKLQKTLDEPEVVGLRKADPPDASWKQSNNIKGKRSYIR